jgi:hypothetical protein
MNLEKLSIHMAIIKKKIKHQYGRDLFSPTYADDLHIIINPNLPNERVLDMKLEVMRNDNDCTICY